MTKKQEQNAKYAEHEDVPIAEGAPTPAQTAEATEHERSWMERFRAAVDDVAARHNQGTAPSPALVAELRALYGEIAEHEGTPPTTEPAPKDA